MITRAKRSTIARSSLLMSMSMMLASAVAGCSDREGPLVGSTVAAATSNILPATGPQVVTLTLLPTDDLQVLEDGRGGYRPARLLVDARLSDGSLRDLTPIATFAVLDPRVARVGPGGIIIGLGPGRTTIEAAVRDARGLHVARRDVVVGGAPAPGAEPERLELHPSDRVLALVSSAKGRAQEQGLAAVLVRTDGSREDVTEQVDLEVLDAVTRAPSAAAALLPDRRLRAADDGHTVDVRAALRRLHLSAATRFVLGPDPAPVTSAVAWSGEPLASSPNPIDQAALAALRLAKVEPAALSGDEEFLRRVTADAAGRLPTEAELRAFVNDRDPAKREVVVARLLASDDFARHWARDVLVAWLAPPWATGDADFNQALLDDLRQGLTLAQVVTKLVTAQGSVERTKFDAWYEGENGRNRPAHLVQTFAGMTMRCAMCHHHVFSPAWPNVRSQGLSSFFALADGSDQLFTPPYGRVEPSFNLDGTAIPGTPIGPDPAATVEQRRAEFAQLFTASEAFHRGTAHRIWADLVAPVLEPEAFIETAPAEIVQPAVIDALALELRRAGTSLPAFLQVVFTSRLYQLTSDSATTRFDRLLARKPLQRHQSGVLERALSDSVGAPLARSESFEGSCGGRGARTVNLAQPAAIHDAPDGLRRHLTGLRGTDLELLIADLAAGRVTLEAAVQTLFRRALSREATADELRAVVAAVAGAPAREALEDVVFGLSLSAEFVSR